MANVPTLKGNVLVPPDQFFREAVSEVNETMKLRAYIAEILEAYSLVPDEEANQPMTLTLSVRELRVLHRLIEGDVHG